MLKILETLMIVSFGASWPFSIAKSVKSRSTIGKSLLFLVLIDFGYACGIAWKILEWQQSGVFAYPMVAYILNLLMVTTDMMVFFRNKKLEKSEA